jgi:hypothetical protein
MAYTLTKMEMKDVITVMDQETVGVIGWDGFAQLLQCP